MLIRNQQKKIRQQQQFSQSSNEQSRNHRLKNERINTRKRLKTYRERKKVDNKIKNIELDCTKKQQMIVQLADHKYTIGPSSLYTTIFTISQIRQKTKNKTEKGLGTNETRQKVLRELCQTIIESQQLDLIVTELMKDWQNNQQQDKGQITSSILNNQQVQSIKLQYSLHNNPKYFIFQLKSQIQTLFINFRRLEKWNKNALEVTRDLIIQNGKIKSNIANTIEKINNLKRREIIQKIFIMIKHRIKQLIPHNLTGKKIQQDEQVKNVKRNDLQQIIVHTNSAFKKSQARISQINNELIENKCFLISQKITPFVEETFKSQKDSQVRLKLRKTTKYKQKIQSIMNLLIQTDLLQLLQTTANYACKNKEKIKILLTYYQAQNEYLKQQLACLDAIRKQSEKHGQQRQTYLAYINELNREAQQTMTKFKLSQQLCQEGKKKLIQFLSQSRFKQKKQQFVTQKDSRKFVFFSPLVPKNHFSVDEILFSQDPITIISWMQFLIYFRRVRQTNNWLNNKIKDETSFFTKRQYQQICVKLEEKKAKIKHDIVNTIYACFSFDQILCELIRQCLKLPIQTYRKQEVSLTLNNKLIQQIEQEYNLHKNTQHKKIVLEVSTPRSFEHSYIALKKIIKRNQAAYKLARFRVSQNIKLKKKLSQSKGQEKQIQDISVLKKIHDRVYQTLSQPFSTYYHELEGKILQNYFQSRYEHTSKITYRRVQNINQLSIDIFRIYNFLQKKQKSDHDVIQKVISQFKRYDLLKLLQKTADYACKNKEKIKILLTYYQAQNEYLKQQLACLDAIRKQSEKHGQQRQTHLAYINELDREAQQIMTKFISFKNQKRID